METETKLHDRESSANPGSESFDSEELLTRTVGRGAEEIERRYKLWLRAETAGLAVVIIVVWGLLLLPVIFYHLPHIDVTVIKTTHPLSSSCIFNNIIAISYY